MSGVMANYVCMYVREEIKSLSEKYLQSLSNHTNTLAVMVLNKTLRLKGTHVLDLPFKN